jgi:hypothetical protein
VKEETKEKMCEKVFGPVFKPFHFSNLYRVNITRLQECS